MSGPGDQSGRDSSRPYDAPGGGAIHRAHQSPGFALRGLKGLWWEPEQYLSWPDFLAQAGYDFFMLCYTFCPETGLRWRQPLRPTEIEIVRHLAEACGARGITLCLALHPLIAGQAWAPEGAAVRFHPTSGRGWFLRYWEARRPGEPLYPDPPIHYGSEADLALLVEKCRQARALGVGAFALCLDDVDPGSTPDSFPSLAAAHLWLADGLRAGLRAQGAMNRAPTGGEIVGARFIAPDTAIVPETYFASPSQGGAVGGGGQPRLFVVPTYYWTAGARAHPEYTAELERGLPPDVEVFWTGEVVRDHAITAEKAHEAAGLFGRRPVVWLNYASNDSFRFAIQLPPDHPPAADLAPETAGLLLNSTRQVGLARLDALIVGTYLSDPTRYDHEQAVQRAVLALVGESVAPLVMRVMAVWQAVPDVRTLTGDLQAGGRVLLDALLGRLAPALATLDTVMPALDGCLADRQLWGELSAGGERLHLLVDALTVLKTELEAARSDALSPAADALAPGLDVAASPSRSALLARLAAADPEAACDAEAILTLTPG